MQIKIYSIFRKPKSRISGVTHAAYPTTWSCRLGNARTSVTVVVKEINFPIYLGTFAISREKFFTSQRRKQIQRDYIATGSLPYSVLFSIFTSYLFFFFVFVYFILLFHTAIFSHRVYATTITRSPSRTIRQTLSLFSIALLFMS